MKSFVSVIIPTLNEGKYIEQTLKSLKNQDYKGRYEIIIVDGMSRDNTVKIARKYADKVIMVKRKGVAAGRNEGVKKAKGNILLFVDADTILLYDTLSKLVSAFKNKKVVGATCSLFPLSPNISDVVLYITYNMFVRASMKTYRPEIAGTCCAYRRNAFEAVDGFDEETRKFEDFDLSERISKLGKIIFVDSTFALTSHRRIKAWGRINSIRKYTSLYLKHLLTKSAISRKEYSIVR